MNNLGYYYFDKKDYDNMMNCYLIAIRAGNVSAIGNLAIYYEKFNDYDNMSKYYLLAFDKGLVGAIHYLG